MKCPEFQAFSPAKPRVPSCVFYGKHINKSQINIQKHIKQLKGGGISRDNFRSWHFFFSFKHTYILGLIFILINNVFSLPSGISHFGLLYFLSDHTLPG